MIDKDKSKSKERYKNVLYLSVTGTGLALTIFGALLPDEIFKSIIVNIASNLITTGFSFFVIDRLLQNQENKSKKILQHQDEIEQKRERQKDEIKRKRERQKIDVILVDKNNDDRFELPIEIRRGEFTRSEILGRIGMLPMKDTGSRFSFNDLGNLRKINEILADDQLDQFEIVCDRQEIEKFKLFDEYRLLANTSMSPP